MAHGARDPPDFPERGCIVVDVMMGGVRILNTGRTNHSNDVSEPT